MLQSPCSSFLACSLCLALSFAGVVDASPLLATDLSRRGLDIVYDNSGHIANVTDPTTGAQITQGAATDGSGVDFNVPAIIWLAFSFAVGIPLMLAGIRFWRLTTGAGVGLALAVCIWAAFINSTGAGEVSDLLITIVVLVAFVLGFAIGLFRLGRVAGMACLTLLGGMSIGARVVLFRENLLVHEFAVNWAIITICGVACFVIILFQQRVAMTLSTASAGTFLTALGIDLVIKKQSGMSFGLRYLFDQNSSHVEYFSTLGWHPPLVTEIIMGASLALIPLCAVAQHYMFKQPFYSGSKDYIISSRFSSESSAQEIADDKTLGGTASLSEKKQSMSESTSPSPDLVQHIPIPRSPTSPTYDHRQPESPTTPAKESQSLVGQAM